MTDSESVARSSLFPSALRLPGGTTLSDRLLVPLTSGGAIAVLAAIGAITTPGLLALDNLLDVVRAASFTGIPALGMTFITISGNYFSLSAEQTAALSAIVFAAVVAAGGGWAFAVVAALGVSVAAGVIQGAVVARGGNPIVTTLAAGAALFGISAIVTGSHAVFIRTSDVDWIGTGRPLGVPIQTWTFVLLTLVAALVLSRSRVGRTITLVGANPNTARSVGLNVGLGAVLAFALSAASAGLAGIFVAAQSHRGLVDQLHGLNIDAVAAVLIGGTAVRGGEGSMLRTTLGAIFIALLQNLVVIRGYSYGVQVVVEGAAVMIAVTAFWILRGGRQ